MERTLILIKPGAMAHSDEIIEMIKQNGFTILQQRRLQLTAEQVTEFYEDHRSKDFFRALLVYMSSGSIIAMVLSKHKAISAWRELIGPTNSEIARKAEPNSVRARFGKNGTDNAVHGSDSVLSAQRETKFFFPDTPVYPQKSIQESRDFLSKSVNPVLSQGLTALCKAKPSDPIRWLADWLLKNNPNQPQVVEP